MKIPIDGGSVSAELHGDPAQTLVALTHGAGGTMQTPQLKSFCDGLASGGVGAVRFNLPYAEAGRRSPGTAARDEACWRAVVEHFRKDTARLVIGGRSYGGRIASHVAAAGAPVDGLVFLAYPLHPPGKPERLRDEHLARIGVPMLFLQGSRDPFATPALLERVVGTLPKATLHWVEDGDHSHKVSGRPAKDVNEELVAVTREWLARA